ncbi:alpha mannosidase-like protein [Dissophora ornata]|nr:alpha mannosidase-like protein [Dissophora ornata]
MAEFPEAIGSGPISYDNGRMTVADSDEENSTSEYSSLPWNDSDEQDSDKEVTAVGRIYQSGSTARTEDTDEQSLTSSDEGPSRRRSARLLHRHQQEQEPQRRQLQSTTSSANIRSRNNGNTAGAAAGASVANGGIRPWILLLIFSLIQVLLSSILPSSGVNASSPSSDQVTDSGTNNGGGGNNAHGGGGGAGGSGGGGSFNHHYFRVLPPITDPTKAAGKIVTERMTNSRRLLLRKEAKDMFLHGYHGYLNHAFPKDELNPVACTGRGPDRYNPNNINVNDVLGDFSLTLIDALDTLAAMREPELFRQAIQLIKRHVHNFDINSRVQVFEVNIRVLGALLSGHLYASDPSYKSLVKGYNGELLTMAEDLGKRLMKAFENTPTGIPWPRVNLRKGVLREESAETCAAGAGSLLLEFGVLSRLTGDRSYEEAARKAMFELWGRRSKIGLMGNTINITSGHWMSAMTGIGAGTDSFYEYLLKSYILFGDEEYLEMYETSQEAIKRNLLHDSRYFYKHVHLHDGTLMAHWVDSLSAFMPGVQVLGGDLESAIKNHLYYYNIWRKYQAIPERFDFVQQSVAISNYPLRPEFIESNYFLYRATKDPFYLEVGEMILRDLQKYTKTRCGWAALQSVVDKKFEDRMESFALSETIKYLYLLFDEENLLHQELKDTNFVFTTEGHVLSLSAKQLSAGRDHERQGAADNQSSSWFVSTRRQHPPPDQQHQYSKQSLTAAIQNSPHGDVKARPVCKPYNAPATFLKSIPYRPDADFARQMVGTREDFRDLLEVDPKGFCEKPTLEVERVIVEFSGPPKKTIFEDEESDDGESAKSTGKNKSGSEKAKELMVIPIKKGVFVNRIVGVKMHIEYDVAHNGYRAVKIADYPLSLNCNVYVEKSSMKPLYDLYQRSQDAHLRIFKTNPSPFSAHDVVEKDLSITPAQFGYWRPRILDYNTNSVPSFTSESTFAENIIDTINQWKDQKQQPMVAPGSGSGSGSVNAKRIRTKGLVHIQGNENGCRPYTTAQASCIRDRMLVVDRGGCLFVLKAYYAQIAGAHSVIVINSEDETFSMTGAGTLSPDPTTSSTAAGSGSGGSTIGEGIHDDDIDIHAVMISHPEGQLLLEWIKQEEQESMSSSVPSPDPDEEREPRLVAGFVQRKVSKEEMANARLSYNSLPIVNIFSIDVPMATFG